VRESAVNYRAEAELKKQLQILREDKAKTELELQRELLGGDKSQGNEGGRIE
jgi:hypothetical protein